MNKEILKIQLDETRIKIKEIEKSFDSGVSNHDYIINKLNRNILTTLSILFGLETIFNFSRIMPFTATGKTIFFISLNFILFALIYTFYYEYRLAERKIKKSWKTELNELKNLSKKEEEICNKLNSL